MTREGPMVVVHFLKRIPYDIEVAEAVFASLWKANENEWRGYEPGTCFVCGISVAPWPRMAMGNMYVTIIGLYGEQLPGDYPRIMFHDSDFGEEFHPDVDATLGNTADDMLLTVNADPE